MLYTNKVLETIKDEGRSKVEISSLYGKEESLILDSRISDYLHQIDDKFHKNLTIVKTKQGYLMVSNRKDDALYLVLDTLDYKHFRNLGNVSIPKENRDEYKIIYSNILNNRANTCSWSNIIVKVEDLTKLHTFQLQFTSGRVAYLTIYDGHVKMHNEKGLIAYLSVIGKEVDINNMISLD